MLRRLSMWTLLAFLGAGFGQSGAKKVQAPRFWNDQDATAIRAALLEGFETSWNSHQPATASTPDKVIDDAIFINTSGGWVKGREDFAAMISRLHAPGGPFHDHTRRHTVEDLRFIRPDVALAVVKTFDIRRAGVPDNRRGNARPDHLQQGRWALEGQRVGKHEDSGNTGRPSLDGHWASVDEHRGIQRKTR